MMLHVLHCIKVGEGMMERELATKLESLRPPMKGGGFRWCRG